MYDLMEYFENFARKVDNNTLTVKEAAVPFVIGMVVAQFIIWICELVEAASAL